MIISSRTPEGYPANCPVCGAAVSIDFSEPTDDAPCSICGCLLWKSAIIRERLEHLLAEYKLLFEDVIRADSLETVEFIMRIEEEFDLQIPDDAAERIQTIGDMIRYLEQELRKREEGQ